MTSVACLAADDLTRWISEEASAARIPTTASPSGRFSLVNLGRDGRGFAIVIRFAAKRAYADAFRGWCEACPGENQGVDKSVGFRPFRTTRDSCVRVFAKKGEIRQVHPRTSL